MAKLSAPTLPSLFSQDDLNKLYHCLGLWANQNHVVLEFLAPEYKAGKLVVSYHKPGAAIEDLIELNQKIRKQLCVCLKKHPAKNTIKCKIVANPPGSGEGPMVSDPAPGGGNNKWLLNCGG